MFRAGERAEPAAPRPHRGARRGGRRRPGGRSGSSTHRPMWCCSTCICPMAVGGQFEGLADDLPDTKCLALSVSDAADDVIGVIRAGARGYVTKTITRGTARRDPPCARGDAVFSPRLAGFVLDAFAGIGPGGPIDVDRRSRARAGGVAPDRSRLHLQRGRLPAPHLREDRRDPRVACFASCTLESPRADRWATIVGCSDRRRCSRGHRAAGPDRVHGRDDRRQGRERRRLVVRKPDQIRRRLLW